MTTPRHLWSGDWRRESASAAAERAARRAHAGEPAKAPDEPPSPPPGPSSAQRAAAWLREARRRAVQGARARLARRPRSSGRAWLIVLASVLSAAAAYAVVSSLAGSADGTPAAGARSSAAASSAHAWLGADTGSFPSGGGVSAPAGALVTNVAPGSPADAAGLEPGDVITQIGNRAIATGGDVDAAISRMHAGQRVEIQYQRGPFTDSAQVTLAARPAGYP
jgi:C-terminal processing protease CtpA/Prc